MSHDTKQTTAGPAVVWHVGLGYQIIVNGHVIREFDELSDDYAATNAKDAAAQWNRKHGHG